MLPLHQVRLVMGQDYESIYEVSLIGNPDVYWSLTFLAVGVGAAWTFFKQWRPRDLRGCRSVLLGFMWASIWLTFSTFWVVGVILHSLEDQRRLRDGHCQVAEGVVSVLHIGARGGKDGGDRIAIGGVEFQYSYYDASKPGYRRIIRKGGRLTQGTKARVHYYDGALLKVEIARDPE